MAIRRAGKCLLEESHGIVLSERGLLPYLKSNKGIPCSGKNPVFTAPMIVPEELKYAMSEVADRVKILDCSSTASGRRKHIESHIAGSVHFDIDSLTGNESSLPGIIPRSDVFAKKVSDLGLNNDHCVVVYSADAQTAARALWLFRVFGHDTVHLLQGGFEAWKRAGGRVGTGEVVPSSTRRSKGMVVSGRGCFSSGDWKLDLNSGFQSLLQPSLFTTLRQAVEISEGNSRGIIADARSDSRNIGDGHGPPQYQGIGERPQVEFISSIPGSVTIPLSHVLADRSTFLPKAKLKENFEKAGLDLSSSAPIVTTSRSGVSAAALSFALHLCGRCMPSNPVYAGGWTEWGNHVNTQVAKNT